MKRIPVAAMTTGAGLALVLILYWVSYQVRFSEVGVRIKFGKAEQPIETPGFGWKLPWPIESVKTYDKRLRVLDTPETELKTQDGQILIVGLFSLWRIDNPMTFHVRLPAESEAEDKIRARLNEARNTVIGRHTMSELFNLDGDLVTAARDKIEREIAEAAAPGLLADYGVKLAEVRIRRNTVPEEATQQIQAAMSAERAAQAARFTEEGRSTAETIKSRAKAARDQIMAFAERRAKEIEAAGVRASQPIYAQIQGEDAEFFIWLRQLEALEAALKTKTTIFLDSAHDLAEPFIKPLAVGAKKSAAKSDKTDKTDKSDKANQ